MKDWMCWTLLVIGVIFICWFGWWLTTVLSLWTCIYITIVLNGIVWCYLLYQDFERKSRNKK